MNRSTSSRATPGRLAGFVRDLREPLDRLLEGLVAVHRQQAAVAVGDDQPGVAAVGAEHDRPELAGRSGRADDRAGAVAEQRRRIAVGGVDVARHDLGADHERVARRAAREHRPRGGERGEEAGAGAADVEGAGAIGAERVRDLGRRVGHDRVLAAARDEHEIELARIERGVDERGARRPLRRARQAARRGSA